MGMKANDSYRNELHIKLYAYKDNLKTSAVVNSVSLEQVAHNAYELSEYVIDRLKLHKKTKDKKTIEDVADMYLYIHQEYYKVINNQVTNRIEKAHKEGYFLTDITIDPLTHKMLDSYYCILFKEEKI